MLYRSCTFPPPALHHQTPVFTPPITPASIVRFSTFPMHSVLSPCCPFISEKSSQSISIKPPPCPLSRPSLKLPSAITYTANSKLIMARPVKSCDHYCWPTKNSQHAIILFVIPSPQTQPSPLVCPSPITALLPLSATATLNVKQR